MLPQKFQSAALQEVSQMAEVAVASGLFGVKTATQAMALMLLCQAEQKHPMLAVREYDIIQGRPALKSQTLMSRFLASGGKQVIHELSDTVARITLSHPQGGEVTVEWTIERARAIGLAGKDNWKHYSRSMLLRRCQAEGVRAVAPFVCDGILVECEAEDLDPPNPLEPLNVTSLTVQAEQVALPSEPTVDYPLDPSWSREVKVRIGREAERLGGKVDRKTAKAIIPESVGPEFEAFVLEVLNPKTEEV